jgi:hypothetical protein
LLFYDTSIGEKFQFRDLFHKEARTDQDAGHSHQTPVLIWASPMDELTTDCASRARIRIQASEPSAVSWRPKETGLVEPNRSVLSIQSDIKRGGN